MSTGRDNPFLCQQCGTEKTNGPVAKDDDGMYVMIDFCHVCHETTRSVPVDPAIIEEEAADLEDAGTISAMSLEGMVVIGFQAADDDKFRSVFLDIESAREFADSIRQAADRAERGEDDA